MGIYYFAVDYTNKQQMWAPKGFCRKYIYSPRHPLPNMVVMQNCRGSRFEIVNDMSTYEEHEFKDVTDKAYKELKEAFPSFKWDDE